jgi:hypothetical protein
MQEYQESTNLQALQEKVENTQDLGEGGQGSNNISVVEEELQHSPDTVCSTSQPHSDPSLTVCSA